MNSFKKLFVFILCALFLSSCAKEGGEVFAIKENLQQSEEAKIKNTFAVVKNNAKLLVKDQNNENMMKLSNAIEEHLNTVVESSKDDEVSLVEREMENLNLTLFQIYKKNVELYLKVVNQVLQNNNKASIEISLDEKHPETVKVAINQVLNNLSTKKRSNKLLSLADQFMVFQLLFSLKETYKISGNDIIDEIKLSNYVSNLIDANKYTGNEALRNYQIIEKLLDDDYWLTGAFSSVYCQMTIRKDAGINERKIFKRLAAFSQIRNDQKERQDLSCFKNELQGLNDLAAEKIEKFDRINLGEVLEFYNLLDLNFEAHYNYLEYYHEKNQLNLDDYFEIQNKQAKQVLLPLVKKLSVLGSTSKYIFENSCPVFKSKYLNSLFSRSVKELKLERCKNPTYALSSLEADLNSLENGASLENIPGFFNKISLVMNAPFVISTLEGQSNNELMRKYHSKLLSISKELYGNKQSECTSLSQVINENKDEREIFIKSGIFCGNSSTMHTLNLNPLTFIIIQNEISHLRAQKVVGGVIINDLADKVSDFSGLVIGYKGTPTREGERIVSFVRSLPGDKTRGSTIGERSRGEGGADNPRPTVTKEYIISKQVMNGSLPDKAYKGNDASERSVLNLNIFERTLLDPAIFLIGQSGGIGERGYNSPMCDSNGTYWQLRAPVFNYSCTIITNDDESYKQNNCANVASRYEGNVQAFDVDAGVSGDGGNGGVGGQLNFSILGKNNISIPFAAILTGGKGGLPGALPACSPLHETESIKEQKYLGSRGFEGKSGTLILREVEKI